jgi:hypothetical protein
MSKIEYVLVDGYADLKKEIERRPEKTLLGPDFMQQQPDGRYRVRFGAPPENPISVLAEIRRVHIDNIAYYSSLR